MTKWLFPRFSRRILGEIILRTLVGALLAGGYGMIHDQVTFTLAPEYFTQFKFEQFAYADLGLGPRLFAAEIGFLATWWIGAIAGWLLGRLSVLPDGSILPRSKAMLGFLLILGLSCVGGFAGFLYGTINPAAATEARLYWESQGVSEFDAFSRVGLIHLFGYFGAMLGFIEGALLLRAEAGKALPGSSRIKV